MKHLIPVQSLLSSISATAQAAELWCMPDKICIPGVRDNKLTEDAAIRLAHFDSIQPVLHSHRESISMSKTFEHLGRSLWDGVNSMSEREILDVIHKDMSFYYSIGGDALRYKASGLCEVR